MQTVASLLFPYKQKSEGQKSIQFLADNINLAMLMVKHILVEEVQYFDATLSHRQSR